MTTVLMKSAVRPHAIDLVCDVVSAEVDEVKESMRMTVDEMTPEFLATWSIDSVVGRSAAIKAPVLLRVLSAAAQTKRARVENVLKSPDMVSR
jgi:hypothetical protein